VPVKKRQGLLVSIKDPEPSFFNTLAKKSAKLPAISQGNS
jgi:hypothetical protein